MSSLSDRELWSKLAAAGLTVGDMPEAEAEHTPWYVRVMLGIAGLIAAIFLLGFVGMAFAFVMQSNSASLAVGLMAVIAAYAVFRVAQRNDFAIMFALAVSFAGQALLIYGILGFLDRQITSAPPWVAIACIEAILAIAMPNFIHRAASAYGAATAFAYACAFSGADVVAAGVVGAAVAFIWLNEARLGKLNAVVAPIGYGLTMSLIEIEGGALTGKSGAMMFGARLAPQIPPWIGEAFVVAALLVSVWVLIRRAGWTMREPKTLLAFAAAAALGAASFKAPGIACGLMIAMLGFSNGNRVLAGLGIAALLYYVSSYYYLLNETLLFKSGVLLATGIVLLGVRWSVLNVVLPNERADA
jgi:uncharacterized membrane protein